MRATGVFALSVLTLMGFVLRTPALASDATAPAPPPQLPGSIDSHRSWPAAKNKRDVDTVWSTYESRHAITDSTPFARGINSIQIVQAQGRYWLASVMWDDERPGLTLPEKYLH